MSKSSLEAVAIPPTFINTSCNDDDYVSPFPAPPLIPGGYGGGSKNPTSKDVLCGRGRLIHTHVGNVWYRDIIQKWKPNYLADSTTKVEKLHLVADFVTEIRASGGRFLSFHTASGLWFDTGDEKARRKVGQALRENAPELRKTFKLQKKDNTAHHSNKLPTVVPIITSTSPTVPSPEPSHDAKLSPTAPSPKASSDGDRSHFRKYARKSSVTSVDSMIIEALKSIESVPTGPSDEIANKPQVDEFSEKQFESPRIFSKRRFSLLMRDKRSNPNIIPEEIYTTTKKGIFFKRMRQPTELVTNRHASWTKTAASKSENDYVATPSNIEGDVLQSSTTRFSDAFPSGNFAYWTALLDKADQNRQQTEKIMEPSFTKIHSRNNDNKNDPLYCLDSNSSSSVNSDEDYLMSGCIDFEANAGVEKEDGDNLLDNMLMETLLTSSMRRSSITENETSSTRAKAA